MQQKRESNIAAGGKTKSVLEATAPLANLPYNEQLIKKEAELLEILKNYSRDIQRVNSDLQAEFKAKMLGNDGLPCKWQGFKPSPCQNNYRNKSEFAVGKYILFVIKNNFNEHDLTACFELKHKLDIHYESILYFRQEFVRRKGCWF